MDYLGFLLNQKHFYNYNQLNIVLISILYSMTYI
jgi:hypothetical protein